jgi:DNA-binding NtrC family response regulator
MTGATSSFWTRGDVMTGLANGSKIPANGSKVLIVDDEVVIADTLAQIFSMHGQRVRTAYSAEHAIELIAAWKPDLAILDVVLPQMNGIDLAIFLRENYPSCQMLLFSGQIVTTALAAEAAKKGHDFEILPKPVLVPDLLNKAARLLTNQTGTTVPS